MNECPRCESQQKFPRLTRDCDIPGIKEVYIRCPTCNYSQVIDHTTSELDRARNRFARIAAQRKYEKARHGQPSRSTQETFFKLFDRVNDLYSDMLVDIIQHKEKTSGTSPASSH